MRPYIHHVQGRLRIRCPKLKGNQAQADHVLKILESQAGIRAGETNTLTGSILIRYDEAFTSADCIVGYLKRMGYASNAGETVKIDHPRHVLEPELGQVKKKVIGAIVSTVFDQLLQHSASILIRAVL